MEAMTLAPALQQLTAVVAGLQAQVTSVTTRDEPLQPSQRTNDDRRRPTGNEVPVEAAVMTDEQTLVSEHQRQTSRQPPVATETTGETRVTAAMSERRGESLRSATVEVAAAVTSDMTPSSEMTAMATAVQQLTAMVSRLQPTRGSGQQPSNQRTTRRVAQTTMAAAGPSDDDGSESPDSSEYSSSSDDDVSDNDGGGEDDSPDGEPRGRLGRHERRREPEMRANDEGYYGQYQDRRGRDAGRDARVGVRDEERATRYVETVKPAMTAVCFVGEERERELRDDAAGSGSANRRDGGAPSGDRDQRQTGEGAAEPTRVGTVVAMISNMVTPASRRDEEMDDECMGDDYEPQLDSGEATSDERRVRAGTVE
ncbi:uncharacterized protein IUM83_10978 [Phytophthora cinnamomi]|uniref:uncharacterized protein n=1 Tax=Phytophthora cinnamomi TaxID=4785 RepID=UPI0035595034|nr:hypothetical protein IUM83_10978 [Phytophthora cinnamomi]